MKISRALPILTRQVLPDARIDIFLTLGIGLGEADNGKRGPMKRTALHRENVTFSWAPPILLG